MWSLRNGFARVGMLVVVVLLLSGAAMTTGGCGLSDYGSCYCQWEYDYYGDLVYNCYYCKEEQKPMFLEELPALPPGYENYEPELQPDGTWIAVPFQPF